ncbi:MAG: hypothetical protein WC028_28290 [Candidatus Obscuribacterales bacterium]|jgi:hypothetical protein
MFNPFMLSLMIFNYQMKLAQDMLLAGSGYARPARVKLTLVAVNRWRLPQRSRAVLSLVQ